MNRYALAAAAVCLLTGCPDDSKPKQSKPTGAAGSGSDAHCVAVRSDYIDRRARLEAALRLGVNPALTLEFERELAELVNRNWACFR